MTYFETILLNRIGCNICGDDDSESAKVEYTDGKIEHVSLCPDCASELADSNQVLEIFLTN